jgi:hypothetical protein
MGWEKIPSGFVEIRPGVYERISNYKQGIVAKRAIPKNNSKGSDPKPQRAVRNDSLAKVVGKEKNTGRIHIRLTAKRKRLIDPDNLIFKYHIDCLRYAGAIPDDSERNVTIETKQEKVGENEETIIELFYYEPATI